MATSQSENDDESNREVIKRGRADGTVDVVPAKAVKAVKETAEEEPTVDNGLSVTEAVHDQLYVEELRRRADIARTQKRIAKHEPYDTDAVREWTAVVDEYAEEIERVEDRLTDGREAAVDARRAAINGGDSL